MHPWENSPARLGSYARSSRNLLLMEPYWGWSLWLHWQRSRIWQNLRNVGKWESWQNPRDWVAAKWVIFKTRERGPAKWVTFKTQVQGWMWKSRIFGHVISLQKNTAFFKIRRTKRLVWGWGMIFMALDFIPDNPWGHHMLWFCPVNFKIRSTFGDGLPTMEFPVFSLGSPNLNFDSALRESCGF